MTKSQVWRLKARAIRFATSDMTLRVLVVTTLVAAPAIVQGQATGAAQDKVQAGSAVIRGRIVAADTGRPLRRAQVTLTAPEMTERRTANTNADGRYELKDLPAGRYTVAVSRNGYLPLRYGQRRPLEQATPLQILDRQTVEHIDFALPRMATISGRIFDEAGDPIADVLVLAMRSAYFEGRRRMVPMFGGSANVRTDDAGQYRLSGLAPGAYFVMATTQEKWTVNTSGGRTTMGYAPTYLPGTTNVLDARRVSVGVGQQVGGNDFAVIPARAVKVSGTAVDSRGRPLAGQIVALAQQFRSPEGGGANFGAGNRPIAADGTFAIENVPPGEYVVRTSAPLERAANGAPGTPEMATLPVVVTSADLENVSLITSRGWSMSGQIITDSGAAPSMPSARVRITGRMLGGNSTPVQGRGQVRDDWTFTVTDIFGPARLRVDLPDEWTLKVVMRDGRDITETPIEMKSGEELSGVQIVVSDRVTTVTGQLVDDKGVPLADGTIVVFASASDKWAEDSRFVRSARPDQEGKYQIRGLAPGDYLAVAIDYVQDGMWNDPDYLESVRRYGQKLTLKEGDSRAISLKLVTP